MEHDFQEKDTNENTESILPNFVKRELQQTANVKVTDPEEDHAKGFFTYLISGTDDIGPFEIRRRYNDFFYFRECLAKKWPGLYIPPIPQKKIAGNKDLDNIEHRKRFFDFFMKRLGRIKHVFTCSITRQFLRNKAVEMEKFYGSMGAPKYNELVADYKLVYQKLDLSGKEMHQIKNGIQNFGLFLKKAEKQLQGLKSQIQIIVEARTGFNLNLNNVNTNLLPDYQKNIYSEYLPEQQKKQPNLIFVNNPKVQEQIKNFKENTNSNSFSICLDHITYQILEVKAMEEALRIRERYESEEKTKKSELLEQQSQLAKLNSGKTTFKSIFSRGSKNEQIQKLEVSIPQLQKQIATLQQFNNLLTIVFGKAELPLFKKNKQIQYYRMMYQISENQIKYLASYGQFMKSVLQGLNK